MTHALLKIQPQDTRAYVTTGCGGNNRLAPLTRRRLLPARRGESIERKSYRISLIVSASDRWCSFSRWTRPQVYIHHAERTEYCSVCSAKTGPGFTRYRGGTIRETSRACKSRGKSGPWSPREENCERYWSISPASYRAGYVPDIYTT